MNACRYFGLGLLAVFVGGCASQPQKTASLSAAAQPQSKPPATTQPMVEPKWEASSTPAELLAQKTAAYARSLQSNDTTDSGSVSPVQSTLAQNAFADSAAHHQHIDPAPVAAAAQLANASLVGQPVSPLIAAPAPVSHDDPYNGPKIMPESADFASASPPSKDELGTRLRKRIRDNPHDIADQLDLQLYGMLNDDPSPELASVTELPSDDRELISALIDGLSNFRSTVREDSNLLQAQKIQPLLEMADRLRSQADLMVSAVALCRRVDGFGKYDPITPLRFPAMQDNKAIVYCEVQNFAMKQDGQMWKTKLSEQVILYTDTGVMAWSDDKREVTDECRNRRHDFFAYNIIDLPNTLTVGRYLLKVSIEDENVEPNRVAEATVPVEIVGK